MKKSERRRQLVIEKGMEIMYRQGYNGTGIKQIVDAAGVPKGSFYNYFDSKEHFALEALRCYTEESLQRLTAWCEDTTLPPLARLAGFYKESIAGLTQRRKFALGCFVGNMCQEMGDVSPLLREHINQFFEQTTRHLTACLLEAQSSGALAPQFEALHLAQFIENSWQGALVRMKACQNEAPLLHFYEIVFDNLLVTK